MARKLIDNKLELTTEDIMTSLAASGWPVPDPADPQAPPVAIKQDGARWAVAWSEVQDDIVPGP